MISVIVPAHNESHVIEGALDSIFQERAARDVEVIVVCNGCTDDTSDKVRQYGKRVRLLETEVASKVNALNLGDELASGYPRIYMDADIRLSPDAISNISELLEKTPFLAASLQVKMDFRNSSWLVRAYYRIWLRLPSCEKGMVGSGIYALTEAGRKRFGKFPDVIADDGYVRSFFDSNEKVIVHSSYSIVTAPANIVSLLKIKTRSRLGSYQLREKYPNLSVIREERNSKALLGMFLRVHLWPMLAAYVCINIITRIRARLVMAKSGYTMWERDDTSRECRR